MRPFGRAAMHVLLAAAALVVASAAGTTSLSMPSPWGYRSCGPPVELSGLTKGSDWPLDAGFRMGSYGLWVLATTSDRGEEVLHEFSDKGMLESTVAPEGGWSSAAWLSPEMLSAVEGGTTLSFVDPHGDRTKRSVLPLCSDGRCLDFPSSTEHITSLSFAPISSEINFIALLETKENGLRMLVKVSSHGEVGPLAGYATDLTTQVLEYTDVAYSAANRTLFILCQPCGAIYEADLEGRILAVDWESLPKLAAAGLNPLKLGISEDGGRVAVFTRPAGHGGSGQLSAHLQCAEASEIQIRALSPPSKAWPVALMDRSKSCCYFGTICLPDNCRILLNQGWTVDLEEPPEPEGDFGVWPLNLMDENGTCCVMEDQCSPWHCDFLISRGWEVPLYRARHPAVEPVASLDMQRCPSQQLKTPADVRGGASGMALDEPRKKIWVVYNEGNGGFRHWLVQYAYDGTPIRTVAIFGPQNPTGLTWLGDNKVAVLDGTQLSINEVFVGPGAGEEVIPGLGEVGEVPRRRVYFGSPAWQGSEAGLSGLAYDPAYDVFYAVKSSQPRSVYLLRWDGTGDHLFQMNTESWGLGDAELTGLDFAAATRSLYVLAHGSENGMGVTTIWQVTLNATRVGFLALELHATAPQGIAVSRDGANIFMATTLAIQTVSSSGCKSSLGAFSLIQESLKHATPAEVPSSGALLAPANIRDGTFDGEELDYTRLTFGFRTSTAMEAIPGLEEFLSRQSPGRKSAALDTTVVEAAAAREDPLLPESMVAIHNAARRVHGANNLTWSTVLAKEAEELAGKCEKGALSSGINVARGQGIDFAQASISWYSQGKGYTGPGSAEGFSNMVWKGVSELGCGIAPCGKASSTVVCLYDPPGNTFGAYGANVQASASASGPVDEIVPPFLREAMKREALAMETAALATNFVPSPGGPRSIAAAAMTRAGELSDPQAAANVLLRAPTPALNFLAKSYDLPPFRVPSGYKPSGIDIGCLSQAMGACPKGFFDCRGLCYTVAQRATMGPSKFSGEGQGIEMRCGACAKSRVAFLGGQDPGLANAFGNVAKALNRPVWVRRRRFLTSPNPLAAEQLHPWYTYTAYSGLEDETAPTYDRLNYKGEYDGIVQPGYLVCVNTVERLRAAARVVEASQFTWEGGCQSFEPTMHRFWPEDNWPLPGW